MSNYHDIYPMADLVRAERAEKELEQMKLVLWAATHRMPESKLVSAPYPWCLNPSWEKGNKEPFFITKFLHCTIESVYEDHKT